MLLRACLLASLFAFGCGDGDPLPENDAGPGPTSDAGDASAADADAAVPDAGGPVACDLGGTGESLHYVIDVFDIAGPQSTAPDVVPGFDLDGIVSDGFDPESCFQADFRSGPPDDVAGVDSKVGELLLRLGINDDLTQDFRNIVQAGSLVILVAIHGVDDLVDDPCVHVELIAGSLVDPSGTPRLTTEERFEPGQSFRTAPPPPLAAGETGAMFEDASIQAGRVTARGGEVFDVAVPLGGSSSFLIRERGLQIAFDASEAELGNGIIGARTAVDETITLNETAFDELDLTAPQLRAILLSGADLDRTDEGCASISLSHVFQGVPAVPVP